MQTLYPAIKPYLTHELAVEAPHKLYIEEVGNPQGSPIMLLHAGPGGGGDHYLRRYFDPEYFRIIIFDQRGSGRSTPSAELKNNTTAKLVEDINTIRHYLGLERFILFGGGWGSLLALIYAQTYPEQITGLLLQRIFLGRKQDANWFYQKGANLIYPDYWEAFIGPVPVEKREAIIPFYANQLQSDNELARMAAAKSWSAWQAHCASIQLHQEVLEQYADPHFALCLATIESHYLLHDYFLKENQVFSQLASLQTIPIYLIHGRYDMITPFEGAWDLHRALPHSKLCIIRDAGHSDREAGMIDALNNASKELLALTVNVT